MWQVVKKLNTVTTWPSDPHPQRQTQEKGKFMSAQNLTQERSQQYYSLWPESRNNADAHMRQQVHVIPSRRGLLFGNTQEGRPDGTLQHE